jgi:hypothetical protein
MAENNNSGGLLALVLLGVITFAGGLLGLAIIAIIFSVFGFLVIQ